MFVGFRIGAGADCVATVCVLVGLCVHPTWSFLSFLLYGVLVFNKFGNVLLFL